MSIPRATARLQLHKDFTFADAAAQIDYYAALGISHLYTSPILTAQPGSTHGYNIVDPTVVSEELGGEAGLRALVQRLHAKGMGLIVDIVPNHMGTGRYNPWWQDVLRWGRASRHARWFDIDWESPDPALHGKLLLPFLGQPYAAALAAGDIVLQFDAALGQFFVSHFDNLFPLAPEDYAAVLETAGAETLKKVIDACKLISAADAIDGKQAAADKACALLRELGAQDDALADIDSALAAFSGATPHGAAELHTLLERQHYRLAHWQNAADEINWRRFFEVSELAGVRIEEDDAFDAVHAVILRLVQAGWIDGVRVDHIDGLTDPAAYCHKLRAALERSMPRRAGDDGPQRPYLIAEKILARDEELPPDWHLDGCTGYEFMDQVSALLHDPDGAQLLSDTWREIGGHAEFAEEVATARRDFTIRNFAAEFNALSLALHRVALTDLASRDVSLAAIRRALTELLVAFPVYRTYADEHGRSPADQKVFDGAAAVAAARLRPADHPALVWLQRWLGGDAPKDSSDAVKALRLRAIARFQQLTPPMAAKSVEDTAFYRYGRLLSRNEVGSEPAHLALSPEQFHAIARRRLHTFPHAMLATATHDHKRGEDGRARLAVLSEIPEQWREHLQRWRMLNAAHARPARGAGIDALDEAMLYQTLIGAWPIGLSADDAAGVEALRQRVAQWQTKALREAKRHSDWTIPNAVYEDICDTFLRKILRAAADNPFPKEVASFVAALTPAGVVNSLSQTLLRLCTPGVPDLYQGTELWDFSMVDPDNRRPVDFGVRQRALAELAGQPMTLDGWRDGRCKQQLISTALHLRQQAADLFAHGDYLPLTVEGPMAHHALAFARVHGGRVVLAAVTRLAARSTMDLADSLPVITREAWGDSSVLLLPGTLQQVPRWSSLLTHTAVAAANGRIALADLLGDLPVNLLRTA